ncbi:hypothetical protein V8C40DRAFT_275409 [Trichoderma camerunense]
MSSIKASELSELWIRNAQVPGVISTTVQELIAQRASIQGDNPAIVAWDGNYTYAELMRLASNLAKCLSQQIGQHSGKVLPIVMSKSKWMPIAMVGALLGGWGIAPLDIRTPAARLAEILDILDPPCILTISESTIVIDTTVPIFAVDHLGLEYQILSGIERLAENASTNIAAVVFTSGSTGSPKGVMLNPECISTSAVCGSQILQLGRSSRLFQFSSFSFDISLHETFMTLVAGGCLCIPSETQRLNNLVAAINTMQANCICTTPSIVMSALAEAIVSTPIKLVVLTGEALTSRIGPLFDMDISLFNWYGATECPIVSLAPIIKENSVSSQIRSKHPGNCWVVQSDNPDVLCGFGEVGELLVESPMLTMGYLNAPGQTETAFVVDPAWLTNGYGSVMGRRGRLYRTGDLVRSNRDWTFDYIGRKDTMVKIRGQRVDLSAIEFRIWNYLQSGAMESPVRVREVLVESTISNQNTQNASISLALQRLWAETLGLDAAVIHTNISFLQYGGDSLSAIAISKALRTEFSLSIQVPQLLRRETTIQHLATLVESHKNGQIVDGPQMDISTSLGAWVTRLGSTSINLPSADSLGSRGSQVLLTGATGYLGTHILGELFNNHQVRKIIIIVRAANIDIARERVRKVAVTAGWWKEGAFSRIEVWLGDLAEPRLGLQEEKWAKMSNIDIIIHNGAVVNYSASYDVLERANVISTFHLLEAALQSQHLRNFVYISGGIKQGLHQTDEEYLQTLNESEGYSQAKYVSEQLTLAAGRLYDEVVHPSSTREDEREPANTGRTFMVIKPGYIIGDQAAGLSNTDDYIWRLVAGAVRMGCFPSDPPDYWLDIAEVTYVAKYVARQAQRGILNDSSGPMTPPRSIHSGCSSPSSEDDRENGTMKPTVVFHDMSRGLPVSEFWNAIQSQAQISLKQLDWDSWVGQANADVDRDKEAHPLWAIQLHLGPALGDRITAKEVKIRSTEEFDTSGEIEAAVRRSVEYLCNIQFIVLPFKEGSLNSPPANWNKLDPLPQRSSQKGQTHIDEARKLAKKSPVIGKSVQEQHIISHEGRYLFHDDDNERRGRKRNNRRASVWEVQHDKWDSFRVQLQPVSGLPASAPVQALHDPSTDSSPATPAEGGETFIIHSKTRATFVVAQLLGLNLFSSFCNGVVVVGLPAMAASLHIDEGLLVWPTSVFYLTAGSCLLLAGSITDVIGTKTMSLIGAFAAAVSAMACGLAQTGGQLIAFRALQGITNAIIVPSPRNLGFACLGFAGPIGFSLGLVLGGVFADSTGWRAAFYLAAATTFALFLVGVWTLPKAVVSSRKSVWSRILKEVDIIGAFIGTASLALLSYVLAYGSLSDLPLLSILPSLISGALTNISTGIFVNRMPVMWSVLISSTLSTVAPLLMALIKPSWPYWYDAFFAQILAPLSCDILFTVGLLVVSDVFPTHMQALSGAVFNTCAQLGTAIGLTVTSLIAASVTNASIDADKASPSALMVGYRAVFWTMFAAMALVCVLSVLGLRTVKQLGVKRD